MLAQIINLAVRFANSFELQSNFPYDTKLSDGRLYLKLYCTFGSANALLLSYLEPLFLRPYVAPSCLMPNPVAKS